MSRWLRERHLRSRRRPAQLGSDQIAARERWQKLWNLPILLAALVPLFVTSPQSRVTQVCIGIGSWLVFLIDLVRQRRIDPDYLKRRRGRVDLLIVVVTFPIYLLPGATGYTALLLLARLARVARVLVATAGMRRFAQRLGRVVGVAASIVVVCSLGAYEAEHGTNPGFATVGDALWWGIVTLTTVGYGDIVPHTAAGRVCGIAIMFTGVAVLGVLAGSLASLFGLGSPTETTTADARDVPSGSRASEPRSLDAELAALRAQLITVERRLGELAASGSADS